MDIIMTTWNALPEWWASPESTPVLVGLWILAYLYFLVRWMMRMTVGMERIESGQPTGVITRMGLYFAPFMISQYGVGFGVVLARKVGLEGGILGLGHGWTAAGIVLVVPLLGWMVMRKVSRRILEVRLGSGLDAYRPARTERRNIWLFPLFAGLALGYSYATGVAGFHFAVMIWGLLIAQNIYMFLPGTGSEYGRRPKLVSSLKAHNNDVGPLRGTPLESDLMALAKHAGYTPSSMVQTYNIAGAMREGATVDSDEWRRDLGSLIWQFSAMVGWNAAEPKVLLPLLRILPPEGYLAYQSVQIAGQRTARIRLRAVQVPVFRALLEWWDGLSPSVKAGSLMGSLVIGIIAFQQVFLFGPQGLGTGRVRILPMMLFAMIPAGSILLFQYLHSPGLWGMVHGYREWKRLTPEVREMPDADAVAVYLGHLAGVEALHLDIRRPEVMATVILSQKRTKQLLRAYSLSPQDIPRVTMERIVADTLENAAAEAAKQVQAAAQGA